MTESRAQLPRPPGTVVSEHVEADGTRVVVMLPDVDTLLGVIGFSRSDAIVLPGTCRPLDGWTMCGRSRPAFRLH